MSDLVWSYVVIPVAIISMVLIFISHSLDSDFGEWLFMRGIPYIAILTFIIYLGSVLLDLVSVS
ncbi:hypothetical protein QV01_06600 [Gallibacterium genomosp. 3]|uniref:Uncharacterized protein n=1 Tax=Gallibacterium genomosp. 3 TaxID=505345 RepID=A0A1A7NQ96_9PAST|nr:hypothetical protein [Gallibacterium genomosp. 3]OBW91785.1 hypothetical protein QV01_06600 [Gallibacterium genomosp. 3]